MTERIVKLINLIVYNATKCYCIFSEWSHFRQWLFTLTLINVSLMLCHKHWYVTLIYNFLHFYIHNCLEFVTITIMKSDGIVLSACIILLNVVTVKPYKCQLLHTKCLSLVVGILKTSFVFLFCFSISLPMATRSMN